MTRHGSMLVDQGDVVGLDLGMPAGSEAGPRRPAIVVTAARVLAGGPSDVQVVPLTRATRTSSTEDLIDPDEDNGLATLSGAVPARAIRGHDSNPERTGNVEPWS